MQSPTVRRRTSRTAVRTALLCLAPLVVACAMSGERDRDPSRSDPDIAVPLVYDPTSGTPTSDDPSPSPADPSTRPSPVEVTVSSSPTMRRPDTAALVQVRPAIDASTPVAHEDSAPSRAASPDPVVSPDALGRLRRALAEIERLGSLERALRLPERLNLQELIIEVIALHDLGVGDPSRYQKSLVEAFERLAHPSIGVRLRMAAFFHDIEEEERGNALLASASTAAPTETEADTERDNEFRITELTPFELKRNGKDLEIDLQSLLPRDQLLIDATLEGLSTRTTGSGYQCRYSAEATLYDENEDYVSRLQLNKGTTAFSDRPLNPAVIRVHYVVERRSEGWYRLEVKITDEFSGEQDLASIRFRLGRPRR
ncbi:MAG: hypothetical protein KDC38_00640 [Planctomycetes bacterium]|nr:hypothetical protein [Planctomycetota bacterium]